MARYYVEEPCEHGEWNVHATDPVFVKEDGSIDRDKVCRGASRRELEDVQIVEAYERAVSGQFAVGVSEPGTYLIIPLSGDTE